MISLLTLLVPSSGAHSRRLLLLTGVEARYYKSYLLTFTAVACCHAIRSPKNWSLNSSNCCVHRSTTCLSVKVLTLVTRTTESLTTRNGERQLAVISCRSTSGRSMPRIRGFAAMASVNTMHRHEGQCSSTCTSADMAGIATGLTKQTETHARTSWRPWSAPRAMDKAEL